MATVRFQANDWKKVAQAIKTELLHQKYLAIKKKHEILKLPVLYDQKDGPLDKRIYEMKKTLHADYTYKEIHPEANVQNGLSLEELDELKSRLSNMESELTTIIRDTDKYEDLLYYVEKASEKQDTIFDGEAKRPPIISSAVTSEMDEITSEEEFEWRTWDSWGY